MKWGVFAPHRVDKSVLFPSGVLFLCRFVWVKNESPQARHTVAGELILKERGGKRSQALMKLPKAGFPIHPKYKEQTSNICFLRLHRWGFASYLI